MKLIDLGLNDKKKFTQDVNFKRLCTREKTDKALPYEFRKPNRDCFDLREQDDLANPGQKILEKYFSVVCLDKFPGSSPQEKLIRAYFFLRNFYKNKLNIGREAVLSYFNTSILKPKFNKLTYEYNPSGEFQTHSGIFPEIDDKEHKLHFNNKVAQLIYDKVIEDKSYISVEYLLEKYRHLYDEDDPLELD